MLARLIGPPPRDTPLVDRMRSPLAVLLRQVRLEKLRLLEDG